MKNPSCTRTLLGPVGPTGQTGRSLSDRPHCLDRSDRSVRPVGANFGCQQGANQLQWDDSLSNDRLDLVCFHERKRLIWFGTVAASGGYCACLF